MKYDQRVIDSVIRKIKEGYEEDIALLVQYGAKKHHDNLGISLYFIPKTERGRTLSFQWILEGVSYDLFPMSWERLIANASLDSPQSYLLKGTRILYSGDEDAYKRFMELSNSLEILLENEDNPYWEIRLNKAYEYVNDCYGYRFHMGAYESDIDTLRLEGGNLVKTIANALGFVNGYCNQMGNGNILRESLKLEVLPKDYEQCVHHIVFGQKAEEIIAYSNQLIRNMEVLLLSIKEEHPQMEPFESVFEGYYEELVKSLNKCDNALQEDDFFQLYELVSYMQEEIALFLAKVETGIWYSERHGFIDYKDSYASIFRTDGLDLIANKDKEKLEDYIADIKRTLKNLVVKEGVRVNAFDSWESFETSFMNR